MFKDFEVQETSLEAFKSILPHINKNQAKILKAARDIEKIQMDWTNRELAMWLGWDINRVTPRVKELREKRMITENQRRQCAVTKNSAIAWRVK